MKRRKTFKAATLWMPWALLVARGAKQWETRGWSTRYRGPLVIHTALRWDEQLEALSLREPFASALGLNPADPRADLRRLVRMLRGCAVCVVRLSSVHPTREVAKRISPEEREFGDWSDQRWGWELTNLHRLSEPVRIRGAQGLWDIDPSYLNFSSQEHGP